MRRKGLRRRFCHVRACTCVFVHRQVLIKFLIVYDRFAKICLSSCFLVWIIFVYLRCLRPFFLFFVHGWIIILNVICYHYIRIIILLCCIVTWPFRICICDINWLIWPYIRSLLILRSWQSVYIFNRSIFLTRSIISFQSWWVYWTLYSFYYICKFEIIQSMQIYTELFKH